MRPGGLDSGIFLIVKGIPGNLKGVSPYLVWNVIRGRKGVQGKQG